MLKKLLQWSSVAVALVFVGLQFVPYERTNPPAEASRDIAAVMHLPPEVKTILARSCNDCHSNRTEWPWYAYVAPASWFVIDHVNEGRQNMNFSDWARYDSDEADHLLQDICQTVEHGTMPIYSYTLLHRDAHLSPTDVQTLCRWSEGERQRLASLSR